jgi:hypothetical protein
MEQNYNIDLEDEKELFQFAIDNSIIDLISIKDAVADMNKKDILAQHSQTIWQGSDGKWHTHVILEDALE